MQHRTQIMNQSKSATQLRTRQWGIRARQLGAPGATVLVAFAVLAGCTADAEIEPATGNTVTSTPATTPPQSPGEGSTQSAEPGEDEVTETVVITITDFAFDVPDTIAPGTQVTIRNEDRSGHTVTSDEEGLFDVFVGGGQEATFTVPTEPGEYSFFCKPHPNMVETLVIG